MNRQKPQERCARGHLYADTEYFRPNGKRYCRACAKLRKSERHAGKSFRPSMLDNVSAFDRIVSRSHEVPCPVNGLSLPCWVPVDLSCDRDGYAMVSITVDGRAYKRKAHQVSYATLVGPMPDGLVPDHLCRNRACFNPFHLDPVTVQVNTARGINHERAKTHCPQGHPYNEENTYLDRHGHRHCRTCHREKVARQKRQAQERAERCPAAHVEDPTPCGGPVVVTVLDAGNAGAKGCEHHAARLLASLDGGRVYALPDAPDGAAIRTFKAADTLRPFPWMNGPRTRDEQLSRNEVLERGEQP